MRILVVNWQDRLNPQAGGAEIHLHEVFRRLVARGHEVTLLTSGFPGAPSRDVVDGMSLHRVGERFSFAIHGPRYFKKAWGEGAFDIVVEDLNKVPLFLPLLTKTPVVLLVHHLFGATAFQEASVPIATATWLMERPLPWVYRSATAVAVSPSTVEDLKTRGLRVSTEDIVYNGVDSRHFSPDPKEDRFPEPTLLYLGRLKKYKRIDLVLRALAELRKTHHTPTLLVAGRGDAEEPLRILSRDLGLGKSVRFLGFVDEEEKIRLFRRAWIHVLTSPKEGWGISALEAAACGTPTVASDSPGLRDAVLHGKTGVLVPHGDVKGVSNAIRSLLEEPAALKRMGEAASEFAAAFTWDRSAEKMLEILEKRLAAL